MNKQTVIAGIIGLLVVAGAVSAILFSTRHNRIELTGKYLQVRTYPVDQENTILLADLRIMNPSTQQFVVQEVAVYADDIQGDVFSERDAQQLFSYYPVLGKKYNANLMIRQKINPNETIDRMVAARFPGNEDRLKNRKRLRVVVTDVDGATTEIADTAH